jgi:hypothetical protein
MGLKMAIDYSETVNIHVNLPRQLVEVLDANRNRHTTRTIQIIRAVEAYVDALETPLTPQETPSSAWQIFRSSR